MNEVIVIYKPEGATPLQALDWLKNTTDQFKESKLTYCGRLDPLAEGVMLVLVDNTIAFKEKHKGLDKIYKVSILFGIETDTYDAMGIIKHCALPQVSIDKDKVNEEIKGMVGNRQQLYPPFSSVRVQGKALFEWAKQDKLDLIQRPFNQISIKSITVEGFRTIKVSELLDHHKRRIGRVKGDFRQAIIIDGWKLYLGKFSECELPLVDIEVEASSGTYMRTIAHELGKILQTGGIAWKIVRTKVGAFGIEDSVRMDHE